MAKVLKKQEQQLNVLFDLVKSFDLTQKEISQVNFYGLLYCVGRLNVLQMVAFLTALCTEKGVSFDKIEQALKD